MSRIWDLVNSHHQEREVHTLSLEDMPHAVRAAAPERRQSPRTNAYVPLFVYGYDSAKQPFHQDTHTMQVSANGGLVRLDANVRCGQKLLLMNRVTKREQECYVVALTKHAKRAHSHVAVSFTQPAPEFWKTRY
jgi:hypothetical protein